MNRSEWKSFKRPWLNSPKDISLFVDTCGSNLNCFINISMDNDMLKNEVSNILKNLDVKWKTRLHNYTITVRKTSIWCVGHNSLWIQLFFRKSTENFLHSSFSNVWLNFPSKPKDKPKNNIGSKLVSEKV